MRAPVALIVEDEPLVRENLADFLEEEGFVVLQAEDSLQALIHLRGRSDIAVMITDVRMPGELDGIDLARIVIEDWPGIQVLVVSGYPGALESRLPKGADFIRKPYSYAALSSQLRRG